MKSKTKTWVVNTRIDIRTLATLIKFYKAQGLTEVKKSTSIRLAVEHYKSLLTTKYPEFETETFQEAIEYLEEINLINLSDEFRNKFTLVKKLQEENQEIDLRKPFIPPKPLAPKSDIDKMQKLLEKKLKETAVQTKTEVYYNEQETEESKEEEGRSSKSGSEDA